VRLVDVPHDFPDGWDLADAPPPDWDVAMLRQLLDDAPPFEDATGVDDHWPPRQPLPDALPDVPALPSELIPVPLRDWLGDGAERLQVPLEMLVAPTLVTIGSLIGRRVAIRPKRYDDWTEVPNLWGGIVGRPGTMKSPAVQEATRHIRRLAAIASNHYAEQLVAAELARERLEMAIEQVKRRGRKSDADLDGIGAELAALRAEERELMPVEQRYLTQDPTTEKLGELLRDNPRGLLVLRDELAGWLASFDQAGHEGWREFFLEGWRGVGGFTYDRIGRGTLHIPALTLSIFGTIQPGKLRQLITAAVTEGRGDDGLLQRLQVTVWPDVQPNWVNVDRWPDSVARQRAATIYDQLDALTAEKVGAVTDDGEIPSLRFAPPAQELFDAWRTTLERRLRGPELTPFPAYESHLSKFRSLMPKLALICHLVDVVDGQVERGAVSLGAAQRAAALVDFLDAHARRVYEVELEPGRGAARALATKLEHGDLHDGMPVRDIRRAEWSQLRSQDVIEQGLRELTALHWVRIELAPTAGRPERIVRVHPDLRGAEV
jgi:putative DNA primase/helicase